MFGNDSIKELMYGVIYILRYYLIMKKCYFILILKLYWILNDFGMFLDFCYILGVESVGWFG